MRALPVFFLLLSACAWHKHFDEPEKWAKEFDDPARDAWQKPDQVVAALGLAKDAKVADVGSGTGYFSVRLARAVPEGWVYGSDIEPAMTQYLEDRASKEELTNLLAVTASVESPNLPEQVDCVLIVDTYHHLENRSAYFASLKGFLKPNGKLAIVDFNAQSPKGPPPEHRLSPEQVEQELKQAGYSLSAKHDFLPYQYFLVFTVEPGALPAQ